MKNKTLVVILVLIVLVGAYLYRSKIKSMFTGYSTPQTQTASTVPPATTGEIIITKTDATKGAYLAGPNGMTLYVFDKDTVGVSNCSGSCATLWPPYVTTAAPATLPANVTTLTRTDGSVQFAYKGLPIYYYTPDKQPGDVTGDGVGGVWHLIKP